jgi:hypothetical protein
MSSQRYHEQTDQINHLCHVDLLVLSISHSRATYLRSISEKKASTILSNLAYVWLNVIPRPPEITGDLDKTIIVVGRSSRVKHAICARN